ncbi:MAG: flagellar hook-basal body complex protein [Firmicutes bacterium]|nr:flagellar hook-basal body complex protein [Bacillota bacterium]
MIRSHYIAAGAMLLERRKMEVITNNIVNVETSGYKRDNLISQSFDDVMIKRIHDNNIIRPYNIINQKRNVGPLDFGVHVDYIDTDYSQGYLETTELPTDIALIGDVYYKLQTPAGLRYSRAGALTVNVEGYLCNPEGYYVQGQNGNIYTGGLNFSIDELGNINVEGEYVDTFDLVSFPDQNALRKQGHNLYQDPENTAQPATNYQVRQYTLEGSNVEIAREMVDMMMVYRVYETNQRILTMIDDTVGKAVNDIARLR